MPLLGKEGFEGRACFGCCHTRNWYSLQELLLSTII